MPCLLGLMVMLCLQSYIFYMCGSGSVFRIRIRIYKGPEYGSNLDPDLDPQHCRKVALLWAVNEASREEMVTSVEEMRTKALESLELAAAALQERLAALSAASAPTQKGRRSKEDWKVAQKAEMSAVKAEIAEIR